MSNVVRTAGVAGTFNYTLSQTPAEPPSMTIYSDAARTIVAVATAPLVATANPAVFTGTYPATLAAGTYFLSFAVIMTVGQPAFIDNDDTLELRAVSGGVGTAAFATPAELGVYLQRTLTVDETAAAELLLDIASAEIRAYTGQTISAVQDDSVTVDLPSGSFLTNLEWPVTAVSSVTVGTTPFVANTDYYWHRDTGLIELIHPGRWRFTRDLVALVYSHGWAAGSPQLGVAQGVCLGLARNTLVAAGIDVKSESIGNYSATYDALHSVLWSEESAGLRSSLNSLCPLVLA